MSGGQQRRHAEAGKLFHEACGMPEAKRQRFLDQLAARDPHLAREVRSLLAHDDRAARELTTGCIDAGMGAVRAELASALDAEHPERIGRHEILALLGEGGMGCVYLGRDTGGSGAVVAIKVIKLGMDTRQVVARFEAERRILELVQHPNIARITGSGVTGRGRPYFVMEYVPGSPLCEYCDRHRLDLRSRLEIVRRVCQAVGHAHGQGIIHRDLKPTNILVFRDGHGHQPKIIDFGVAKAMERGLTPTTIATGGSPIGTPEYMSPEQATAGRIDARSDVYALGLVLYELITGASLHTGSDGAGRSPGLGPESERRPIRVIAPSRRLRSMHADLERIADRRDKRAEQLVREVRGDLDRIVLRALEPDPADRYASAAELAEDLERHVGGRPVVARRHRRHKRWRRLLTRRYPLVAGALCTLLLLAGCMVTAFLVESGDRLDVRRQAVRTLWALERGALDDATKGAAALWRRADDLPDVRLVWARVQHRRAGAPEPSGEDGSTGEPAARVLRAGLGDRTHAPFYRALLEEIAPPKAGPQPAALEAMENGLATAEDWYLASLATLDPHDAERAAWRAVSMDESHRLAWSRLAFLWQSRGHYDRALYAADQLVRLSKDRPEWELFRAHLLLTQGRYEEALARYSALIEEHSQDPSVRDRLGRGPVYHRAGTRLCLGDPQGAVEDYTAALSVACPTAHCWSRFFRAAALWMLGRHEQAVADYREHRRLWQRPCYADARAYLVRQEWAQKLREAGRDGQATVVAERAQTALRRAAATGGTSPWLSRIFACLLGKTSPRVLLRAAGDDPRKLCEANYYAGEVYRLRGQREASQRAFQRCLRTGVAVDPDTFPPQVMNEYHLARWRLGLMGTRDGGEAAPEGHGALSWSATLRPRPPSAHAR